MFQPQAASEFDRCAVYSAYSRGWWSSGVASGEVQDDHVNSAVWPILHTLSRSIDFGHCFLNISQLCENAALNRWSSPLRALHPIKFTTPYSLVERINLNWKGMLDIPRGLARPTVFLVKIMTHKLVELVNYNLWCSHFMVPHPCLLTMLVP